MSEYPTPWRVITVGNTIKSHAIVDANGRKVCSGISPKTNIAERIVECINLLYFPGVVMTEYWSEMEDTNE